MLPTRIALALVTALALSGAACGSKPDAEASVPAADSAQLAASADSAAADSAAAAQAQPVPVAPADPSAPLELVMRAGRSKRDSISFASAIRAGMRAEASWPAGPAPRPGAILPHKRIIAFYGNPLSKRMGVLGEYPVEEMLTRLDKQIAEWKKADPSTPIQPALHLVTVVAQGAPGRDGKYRLRMDSTLIEKVYDWAKQRDAILFLDIQVGHATVQEELPRLLGFLSRPDVHLGLDPEFSMHYANAGIVPGKKIGIMEAADVNYAIRTLSKLTADKNLPPKVLVVHRFTQRMVQNATQIKPDANVQVVMHMDGWGPPWLKFDSYRDYAIKEPVQFTGFKIFYGNDTKKGDPIVTPTELLQLRPRPLYIQYQ